MVQFKDSFLGVRDPPHPAVTTVQKCIRAGGKHNDLDNVGYTARHQTFFEMLGNFSFGSYWKADAIALAWKYLTKEVGLPEQRLSATVLHGDEETADIWRKVIGLPDSKIRYCGPEDNFWSMGEGRGPCGPCTEIFFDQGATVDGEQFLEIWNLVFMQYEKSDDGSSLEPLPTKCIDTGMGLERLASVVQGVSSNWATDCLFFLIESTRAVMAQHALKGNQSVGEVGLRVIADHLRAACFLIAEGVIPGPQSRSYILRRILRRAIRFAYQGGAREPFLAALVPAVVEVMGGAYPELKLAEEHIKRVLTQEEVLFFATIQRAMDSLNAEFSSNSAARTITGETAWNLYFHLGFPLDLTEVVATERGWAVDTVGFGTRLEQTRQLSRENWKGSGDQSIPPVVRAWRVAPKFVGFEEQEVRSYIVASAVHPDWSNEAWLAIDPCPFYAESGGQVGDRGQLHVEGGPTLAVLDSQAPYAGSFAIKVQLPPGLSPLEASSLFEIGRVVSASVDRQRRTDIRRNHTATHLLHSALRSVLGKHVAQAGSLVEPHRLRFDFTHHSPLNEAELVAVEAFVNDAIHRNIGVSTSQMAYQAAISEKGATALFGDKYETMQTVRVVDVPSVSVELCGGTHVSSTSEILMFKIVGQQAIGAGTRRIEAATGRVALNQFQARDRILTATSVELRTEDIEQIPVKVRDALERLKVQAKAISKLQSGAIQAATVTTVSGKFQGVPIIAHLFDSGTTETSVLREKADALRQSASGTVHLLVCGDRLLLTFGAGHSGNMLRELSIALTPSVCKGGGGATIGEGKLFVHVDQLVEKLKFIVNV